MNAIVFTSHTGHTREYARLLGEHTGLPVYDLKTAKKRLPRGEHILYLGWLMAGNVKGYKKAARLWRVEALCGVGMAADGSQLEDIQKANALPDTLPLFSLQGGMEPDKLRGIYKFMIACMKCTVGKSLARKPDPTEEEVQMLRLLQKGENCVSASRLTSVLEWIRQQP